MLNAIHELADKSKNRKAKIKQQIEEIAKANDELANDNNIQNLKNQNIQNRIEKLKALEEFR